MTDSGNSHVIRVLYVEDNEFDRELVAQVLERDGFALEIVTADNEADFRSSLERPDFDLILSDFTLPQFSGDHALTLARELRPEIPFLFFSGTIGEERAVASLRAGAVDYVLKQNLDRLPSAIRRALREASQKAENKQASLRLAELAQRMHLLLESSGEGIYGTDRQGRCTFLNR
ncbi:MAG: histidine kinase, partial [Verrucomicrobiales bacterium]|nr:histidine kinase [Verrucomicrobiales bacterium]